MKIKILKLICMISILYASTIFADPLTPEQIKNFKIEDLQDISFDKRMSAYRIIQETGSISKYKAQVRAAIIKQLQSDDIMQKRTGIQGENLFKFRDEPIHSLILANIDENQYKSENQNIYLQQALTEYLLWQLKDARENPDCILF